MTRDDSKDGASSEGSLPPVPIGIQRLLHRASLDDTFMDELERNPELAATAAGVALTENERAVLRSIPVEQLKLMARRLRPTDMELAPQPVAPPPPMIAPQGVRPDVPPERPSVVSASKGIRPTPVIAAAAALAIGGAAIAECTGVCDGLARETAPVNELSEDD